MFWKIYLVGIMLYFGLMWFSFHKIGKILHAAYQESEEFKETIDTFTQPIPPYTDKMRTETKVKAVLLGLCPIIHWVGVFTWGMIVTNDEMLDELIRRALDKILN